MPVVAVLDHKDRPSIGDMPAHRFEDSYRIGVGAVNTVRLILGQTNSKRVLLPGLRIEGP